MEELKNRFHCCQYCGNIIFIGYKLCLNCKTPKTKEQFSETKEYWIEQRSK